MLLKCELEIAPDIMNYYIEHKHMKRELGTNIFLKYIKIKSFFIRCFFRGIINNYSLFIIDLLALLRYILCYSQVCLRIVNK